MEKDTEQNKAKLKDLDIFDYIFIMLKWWKFTIVNVIIICILTVIYTLLMPKTFTSTTVVMPLQKGEGFLSSITSQLPIAGILGGLSTVSEEMNTFMAILKSRTIAETVITHFNLIERYESETIEDAIETFQDDIEIIIDEEEMLKINVSASTKFFHSEKEEIEARELSANMANFIISELDRINKKHKTQQAKYNRIFIEKRYKENQKDIKSIEEEMKKFGETYGMISLPDQVSAAISAAAELESGIFMKEVELEALRSSISKVHPEIKKKEIEILELKKKLKEFAFGTEEANALKIFPVFSKVPELGMKYLRLKRELEVQNLIYEFLTTQYEQAKLQEAKDTPTVQVLDKAIPPIKKSAPKRIFIVIVAFFTAIILNIFLVFFLEHRQDIKLRMQKRLR